ncbi:efflux RND transporter periplasmic adaptor subunit [Methylomarinum vadi]|uniref:efflux RND transporter periplasmic adaptor subunit n=1 Tax=Methylomarinum vadi TaxID=438855 RepID=UPI0004DF7B71|nr:efflux RND transporter periplasmic adaptor subunit [Methylomarinum vadi]
MHSFRFITKVLLILPLFYPFLLSAAEKAVPVRVATVREKALLQRFSLPGEITTQRLSRLSSQVDAMVVEVTVEEGDHVKQGDVLIRLDDELTRLDLLRSAAALEEAKAQLQESKRQRAEFSRLVGEKFIANTSYEASESKVRINAAVVKRLQVEKQRYQALLERHVIKAPFAGVISEKLVEVGQWVKVDTRVLTLVDDRNLRVEVDVPQRYFPQLNSDTVVEIIPDPLPEESLSAKVTRVIPVANPTSHNFPLHIDIENESLPLTPGMSVRVKLQPENQRKQAVLLLPRDAIVKQPDNSDSVWLVKQRDDGLRAQRVEVTTGQVVDNQIEIVDGQVAEGDRVVVRGNEILKPQQLVRIIPR